MIYQEKASQTQRDRFLTWAHWFALVNILLSVVITSIYMVSVPFPETWIGNIYLLLHWLGHSGFIIF